MNTWVLKRKQGTKWQITHFPHFTVFATSNTQPPSCPPLLCVEWPREGYNASHMPTQLWAIAQPIVPTMNHTMHPPHPRLNKCGPAYTPAMWSIYHARNPPQPTCKAGLLGLCPVRRITALLPPTPPPPIRAPGSLPQQFAQNAALSCTQGPYYAATLASLGQKAGGGGSPTEPTPASPIRHHKTRDFFVFLRPLKRKQVIRLDDVMHIQQHPQCSPKCEYLSRID